MRIPLLKSDSIEVTVCYSTITSDYRDSSRCNETSYKNSVKNECGIIEERQQKRMVLNA